LINLVIFWNVCRKYTTIAAKRLRLSLSSLQNESDTIGLTLRVWSTSIVSLLKTPLTFLFKRESHSRLERKSTGWRRPRFDYLIISEGGEVVIEKVSESLGASLLGKSNTFPSSSSSGIGRITDKFRD